DARDRITVRELVEAFWDDTKMDISADHRGNREFVLTGFKRDFGDRRTAELRPLDLRNWLRAHPEWRSAYTRQAGVSRVRRVFLWGVEQRLCRDYPFRGVNGGPLTLGTPMSEDDYQTILRHASPPFRDLVVFLRYTGCRPVEAACVRFSEIDWARK